MSFLDKLEEYVYLQYVLKVLGVVLFGLGMFKGWTEIHTGVKILMITGVLAFFVGLRYSRIYKT